MGLCYATCADICCQQTHAGTANVQIYPDMGVAAMLKNQWQDADFAFASLSDRNPVSEDDDLIVLPAPDPQGAQHKRCIVTHLHCNSGMHKDVANMIPDLAVTSSSGTSMACCLSMVGIAVTSQMYKVDLLACPQKQHAAVLSGQDVK